ncbi:MAG: alpha/beta hydrolase [Bdellovibrionota bacterium]
MSRFLALLFISIFSLSATPAVTGSIPPLNPPAGSTCGKVAMPSLGDMSYCLTPGSKDRTLVFFHGIMNNHAAWNGKAARSLTKSFRELRVEAPTVLTVSMGRVFFLSGRRLANGFTDVEEVTATLVKLVRELGLSKLDGASKLDLMGDSMGGNNSLHLYLRNPELFRRFAMICPANSRVSPFVSSEEWERNLKDEGANYMYSFALKKTLQHYYESDAVWNAESPLHFIRNGFYKPLVKPEPIFIGIVKHDPYGFNKVERDLADLLEKKGHTVTFTKSDAGHCYIDTEPLARFFLQ